MLLQVQLVFLREKEHGNSSLFFFSLGCFFLSESRSNFTVMTMLHNTKYKHTRNITHSSNLHKDRCLHNETKSLSQEIKVTETYKYGSTRKVGVTACLNKYDEEL